MKHRWYDDDYYRLEKGCSVCDYLTKFAGVKCSKHKETPMHTYIVEYTDGLGVYQYYRLSAASTAAASEAFNKVRPGTHKFTVYEKRNEVAVKVTTELSYS